MYICIYIHTSIHPSIYLSVRLSVCLCVYLSIYLSISTRTEKKASLAAPAGAAPTDTVGGKYYVLNFTHTALYA